MAPKVQTTKAAKAAAAMAGGKARKKKWNAKRVKDKAKHQVILDQALYDRIFKEAPTFKLLTVSILVDRFKINGSLARRALTALAAENLIKQVVNNSSQKVYTRMTEA